MTQVLEAFLFVSLSHSRLSDSQYLTGSYQLKDWHAGVHNVCEGTAVVVFIVCANDAWYLRHDCLTVDIMPDDQEQMERDTRYTSIFISHVALIALSLYSFEVCVSASVCV